MTPASWVRYAARALEREQRRYWKDLPALPIPPFEVVRVRGGFKLIRKAKR